MQDILQSNFKKVNESDQDRKLTDFFFFDSGSNVQTTNEILCAIYPQAMCFFGGRVFCPYFLATFQTQIKTC